MIRTRIDSERVVTPRAHEAQDQDRKPRGLWYECDGDWRKWCADEQPDWIDGHHLHSVTLGDEKMIVLASAADIDAFHECFAVALPWPFAGDKIDWPAVARAYDGIEIAPYIWKRRLNTPMRWYYSWDCASGCIWRPRGVRVEWIEGPLTVPHCPCGKPITSYETTCWNCRDTRQGATP